MNEHICGPEREILLVQKFFTESLTGELGSVMLGGNLANPG